MNWAFYAIDTVRRRRTQCAVFVSLVRRLSVCLYVWPASVKVFAGIFRAGEHISGLRSVAWHVKSHTVTCHSTVFCLNPSLASRYLSKTELICVACYLSNWLAYRPFRPWNNRSDAWNVFINLRFQNIFVYIFKKFPINWSFVIMHFLLIRSCTCPAHPVVISSSDSVSTIITCVPTSSSWSRGVTRGRAVIDRSYNATCSHCPTWARSDAPLYCTVWSAQLSPVLAGFTCMYAFVHALIYLYVDKPCTTLYSTRLYTSFLCTLDDVSIRQTDCEVKVDSFASPLASVIDTKQKCYFYFGRVNAHKRVPNIKHGPKQLAKRPNRRLLVCIQHMAA